MSYNLFAGQPRGAEMRRIEVSEARDRLSELLVSVEAGETITITRGGRPFARLEPISVPDRSREDALRHIANLRARLKEHQVSLAPGDILCARDAGRIRA